MNKLDKKRRAKSKEYKLAIFGDTDLGHVRETDEQRAEVIAILSQSPDDRMLRLTDMLRSPDYHTWSLGRIAQELHIGVKEIIDQLKLSSHLTGAVEQARLIPVLMKQSAEAALNETRVCTTCDGDGKVYKIDRETDPKRPKRVERTCPDCGGKGTYLKLGDTDRLKYVFETFDIIGNARSAPLVAIQQNFTKGGSSMEDLVLTTEPLMNKDAK